jgi:hypothetical protein
VILGRSQGATQSRLVESTRMPHIQFDCIVMPLHVLTWLYDFKDMWRAPGWQRLMQLMLLRKLRWEFLHKGNASILRTSWFPAQQSHSTSDLIVASDLKLYSSRCWRPRTQRCTPTENLRILTNAWRIHVLTKLCWNYYITHFTNSVPIKRLPWISVESLLCRKPYTSLEHYLAIGPKIAEDMP